MACVLLLLLCAGGVHAARAESMVQVRAVVDHKPLVAGQDATLAVQITVDEGWHIQSALPHGDNWIPSRITITAPPGLTAGAPMYPESKDIPSGLPPPDEPTLAVYTGTITVLVPLTISPTAAPGAQTIHLALVSQACNDETNSCLPPEKTKLDVTVTIAPAGTASPAVEAALFDAARKQKFLKMPGATTSTAPAATTTAPAPTNPAPHAAAVGNAEPGLDVELLSDAAQVKLIEARNYEPFNRTEYSLGLIMLFALCGGAILNIMPCVLPVIPLKVLALVQQAHGDRRMAVLHGVVFSAGVISLFMVLAAILRTFGLFYGQQFQSTTFLIAMAMFVLALALSMIGVWTVNPPQAVYNAEGGHGGFAGSFLSGLLATLLATPCSAPYLGPVLAWALIQPTWVTVLALALVGVGMSLPYLLLTAFPSLLSFLPRAGRWSELLKQGLGIVMIGVAIYLITLITNVTLWPWVFFGAAILGLTCWAWGQIPTMSMSLTKIWTIRGTAVAAGLLMTAVLYHFGSGHVTTAAKLSDGGQVVRLPAKSTRQWLPFNVALLDEALREGRPVVVDWTADWCINCHVVEATVLTRDEVLDGVISNNAVLLKADVTDDNPAAQALNGKLGGKSIPVLAIFSPLRPEQPVVKRDLYTRQWVISELQAARVGAVASASPDESEGLTKAGGL